VTASAGDYGNPLREVYPFETEGSGQLPHETNQDQLLQNARKLVKKDEVISLGASPAGNLLTMLTSAFPLWVAAAAISAYFFPTRLVWFKGKAITNLLSFAIFAIGLTFKKQDLPATLRIFPAAFFTLALLQYTSMPLFGWGLGHILHLPEEALHGLLLVACSPPPTCTILLSALSHGNAMLSAMLSMTSMASAAVMTPLFTQRFIGVTISMPFRSLFLSQLEVVGLPLLMAVVVRSVVKKRVTHWLAAMSPLVTTVALALICGSVVGQGLRVMVSSGVSPSVRLGVTSVLAHLLTLLSSYTALRVLSPFDASCCRSLALELGVRNTSIGLNLAQQVIADCLCLYVSMYHQFPPHLTSSMLTDCVCMYVSMDHQFLLHLTSSMLTDCMCVYACLYAPSVPARVRAAACMCAGVHCRESCLRCRRQHVAPQPPPPPPLQHTHAQATEDNQTTGYRRP
jgi:BASS family bile acid:Na+ symporter